MTDLQKFFKLYPGNKIIVLKLMSYDSRLEVGKTYEILGQTETMLSSQAPAYNVKINSKDISTIWTGDKGIRWDKFYE